MTYSAHFQIKIRKISLRLSGFSDYAEFGHFTFSFCRGRQRNVRMGYWPSVRSGWLDIGQVLFFACLWTETKSRSINSQKKRTRPISSHLDRTNLVNKGFIICNGFWENFACGIQRIVPSWQDCSILPARVANHSARFGSSFPLAELAI